MNKIIKSTVKWNQPYNTADYSFASVILNAVRNCLAVLMLILSALFMAGDVYTEITIEKLDLRYVVATVVLLGIIIDIIFQFIENHLYKAYTLPYQIAICLAGLGLESHLGSWFYSNHSDEINCGLYGIQAEYLPLYNWYYNENVYIPNFGNEIYIPCSVMFFLLLVIGVFFLLSFLTKSKKIFILLPFGVLTSQMLVGKTPGWMGFAFLIIGVYLTFDGNRVERYAGKFSPKNTTKKVWLINLYQTLCVLVVMFAMAYLMKYVDEKAYETLDKSKAKVTEIQNDIENSIYGKYLDFSYDTHSITNSAPSYKNTLFFTITCDEKPKTNIYLKDYIGTNFANGRWLTDVDSFKNSCSVTDIKVSDMQTLLMESYIDSFEKGKFHIEYKNKQHNLLTPYYFKVDDDQIADMSRDALISRQRSKKTFDYSGSISTFLTKQDIQKFSGIKNDDSTELRYRWYRRYVEENYINISNKVPSSKKLADSINVYSSGNEPQDINKYIYEVSMEVKKLLSDYTYDRNLDPLDKNTNAVEYFLATSKKGYCIHFATAATLILRNLGVPARYVSGYIVKQKEFSLSKNKTYSAKVLDSAAHAWVEVFYPNIGWVPLEVTPGYDSTNYDYDEEENNQTDDGVVENAETDNSTDELENEKESIESEKNSVEEQNEPESEPESNLEEQSSENEVTGDISSDVIEGNLPNGDQPGKIDLKKYILPFVIVLSILGLIYLVFRFVKIQRENERKKFQNYMNNHQYKRAVKKINRKLYKRMKRKGKFIFGSPSDDEYKAALKECFYQVSSEKWDQYIDIVKEAAYSGGNVEEKNAEFVISLYQNIKYYDRIITALKYNVKIFQKWK